MIKYTFYLDVFSDITHIRDSPEIHEVEEFQVLIDRNEKMNF